MKTKKVKLRKDIIQANWPTFQNRTSYPSNSQVSVSIEGSTEHGIAGHSIQLFVHNSLPCFNQIIPTLPFLFFFLSTMSLFASLRIVSTTTKVIPRMGLARPLVAKYHERVLDHFNRPRVCNNDTMNDE